MRSSLLAHVPDASTRSQARTISAGPRIVATLALGGVNGVSPIPYGDVGIDLHVDKGDNAKALATAFRNLANQISELNR